MSQAGLAGDGGGGGGGPVDTLTGNLGVATPVAGNINVVGQYTTTSTGSGNTLTFSPTSRGYPVTTHVVGPVGFGGYQTIQSALNDIGAGGSGTIYVLPATYTENLVFPNGINVTIRSGGDDGCGDATLVGIHTPPTTGNVLFWMVALHSATHVYSSVVAGSASLLIAHNIHQCNGYIFNLPNWTGEFVIFAASDFGSTSDGVVNNSGGATVFLLESSLGVGSVNPMVLSGFSVIEVNNIACPISTVGSAVLNFYDSNFTNSITIAGSTSGYITKSYFSTGSTTPFTYNSSANFTFAQNTIDSSSNPIINGVGPGILSLGGLTFINQDNIAPSVPTSLTPSFYPCKGTDGQVFLGATNSSGRFGTLTSSDSSITYVTGANSLDLTVASGTGVIKTITGNSGGAESPSAGNFNILGTGSITVAGSANTETVQLTGLTNHAVLVGAGSATITKLAVGSSGQVLIGATGADPAFATLTSTGGTIAFTTGANSLNLEVAGAGLTWVDATGATQALLAEHGYVTDRGGGVTYTLPASGTLGDEIQIVGKLGLATITPNANQQILIGSGSGTVGVTGTAVSNNVGDCITLICITAGASTVWRANSTIGTWTLN